MAVPTPATPGPGVPAPPAPVPPAPTGDRSSASHMRTFEQALGRMGAQDVAAPPPADADPEAAALLAELMGQPAGGLFGRLLHTTFKALNARLVPVPRLLRRLVRRRGSKRGGGPAPRERKRRAVAGLRWPAKARSVPRPRYLARLREPAAGPAWIAPAARPALARMRRLALDALRRRGGPAADLRAEQLAIAFAQAERDLAGPPQGADARRLFLDLRHAAERAQLTPSRAGVRRLGLEIGLKELDLKIAEGDAVGPAIAGLRSSLREWVAKARLATEDAAIEAIVAEAAGALQRVDRLVRPGGLGAIGGVGPRAERLSARIVRLAPALEAAPEGPARTRLRLALAWRRHALRHLA